MGKTNVFENFTESKEYKDFLNLVGTANCREFLQKSEEELRAIIAECEVQKTQIKKETESMAEYRAAVETLKDLRSAMNSAIKPLNIKQAMASLLINFRRMDKASQ